MNLGELPHETGLIRVKLFASEAECIRHEKFLGENDGLVSFIHAVSLGQGALGKQD